ncbi:MAG: tRNA (adenosine(37)-N6)-threonylcarbamoyltransferase complex transferase subunit TsaD [Flavobacteriales bacterium]
MEKKQSPIILSIESSCDDTSAAVLSGLKVLSNVVATQEIHSKFGGVVPELASRKHMANIVPTIMAALEEASISQNQLDALAFTQGPGLLGSLLVGGSFIKGMRLGSEKKLIAVNHMHAHIMAHFLDKSESDRPKFPFLCLTVSGGHTQIVLVKAPNSFELLGETIDDAAGEAFDKTAKILGLDYPGGPLVDKLAQAGDPMRFKFTKPDVKPYHFSFSGVKTNVLQFLQRETRKNPDFIKDNLNDICASVQHTIVSILLLEFKKAALEYGVSELAIAGGVSANSGLRKGLVELCTKHHWNAHIPKFEYCTDNAAMIGAVAFFKYQNKEFTTLDVKPSARLNFS